MKEKSLRFLPLLFFSPLIKIKPKKKEDDEKKLKQ